jgi:AcrR family transcriptional regulator
MIAETRAKLIAAARHAFGTIGYAEASMDDFTASAGLTRGALYHHFGDKKGLLQAVIDQIDAEMLARMRVASAKAKTLWDGFVDEGVAYSACAGQ